jgi:hypothetical protein
MSWKLNWHYLHDPGNQRMKKAGCGEGVGDTSTAGGMRYCVVVSAMCCPTTARGKCWLAAQQVQRVGGT